MLKTILMDKRKITLICVQEVFTMETPDVGDIQALSYGVDPRVRKYRALPVETSALIQHTVTAYQETAIYCHKYHKS